MNIRHSTTCARSSPAYGAHVKRYGPVCDQFARDALEDLGLPESRPAHDEDQPRPMRLVRVERIPRGRA